MVAEPAVASQDKRVHIGRNHLKDMMRDTAYFSAAGRFTHACLRLDALLDAAPAALPASVQAELAALLARAVDGSLQPTEAELDALTARALAALRDRPAAN